MTNVEPMIYSDFPVSPGVVLAEELEARAMTQKELAARTGRPAQAINEIVQGKKAITYGTALALERVLGVPAHFWTNLESLYQMTLAKSDDKKRLEEQIPWLSDFPVRELEKRGWIKAGKNNADKVGALLEFLGIASFTDSWSEAAIGFRITGKGNYSAPALAVWLRKGLLDGSAMETATYGAVSFQKVLQQARGLTNEPPEVFAPKLKELCASAGVAVVFTRELPRVGANGVARWLANSKAMIQLNIKGKWADIFWFTFFHEAGHLVRQPRNKITVDGLNDKGSPVEQDADEFASEMLIASKDWEEFLQSGPFTPISVRDFAAEQGIAPGIVVGRLQHEEKVSWSSALKDMKVRFTWSEDEDT